ncbi:MAG: hypothetical protein IJZ42_01580 [Lachnospiraceae bacterium]|nr:hypothetical protein [Lachnospiraceae bacterium]
MKCNVSTHQTKQKANKLALIKNKKKIDRVARLGMLHDRLEAEYKAMPDSPSREETKAKMDEIAEQIKTLSAEIKSEVYK